MVWKSGISEKHYLCTRKPKDTFYYAKDIHHCIIGIIHTGIVGRDGRKYIMK